MRKELPCEALFENVQKTDSPPHPLLPWGRMMRSDTHPGICPGWQSPVKFSFSSSSHTGELIQALKSSHYAWCLRMGKFNMTLPGLAATPRLFWGNSAVAPLSTTGWEAIIALTWTLNSNMLSYLMLEKWNRTMCRGRGRKAHKHLRLPGQLRSEAEFSWLIQHYMFNLQRAIIHN